MKRQTLDIDRLIDLARLRPEEFEAMRSVLIEDAIRSCDKPDFGHRLQAAIALFHQEPQGQGADRLRSTLADMNRDLGRLADQARAIGKAQERMSHG